MAKNDKPIAETGQRLQKVYDYYKTNVRGYEDVGLNDFAKMWGIEYASMRNYFDGKFEMKQETITRFIQAFPIVDIEWVLTGKGSMLKYEGAPGKISEDSAPYMNQRMQDTYEAAISAVTNFSLFMKNMDKVRALAEL